MHGRHKAVWVSVLSDLNLEAKRDLTDVGVSLTVESLGEVEISFKFFR